MYHTSVIFGAGVMVRCTKCGSTHTRVRGALADRYGAKLPVAYRYGVYRLVLYCYACRGRSEVYCGTLSSIVRFGVALAYTAERLALPGLAGRASERWRTILSLVRRPPAWLGGPAPAEDLDSYIRDTISPKKRRKTPSPSEGNGVQ